LCYNVGKEHKPHSAGLLCVLLVHYLQKEAAKARTHDATNFHLHPAFCVTWYSISIKAPAIVKFYCFSLSSNLKNH